MPDTLLNTLTPFLQHHAVTYSLRACNTPAHTQHHAVTSVALPTLTPVPQLPRTALYPAVRTLTAMQGAAQARGGFFHLGKRLQWRPHSDSPEHQ